PVPTPQSAHAVVELRPCGKGVRRESARDELREVTDARSMIVGLRPGDQRGGLYANGPAPAMSFCTAAYREMAELVTGCSPCSRAAGRHGTLPYSRRRRRVAPAPTRRKHVRVGSTAASMRPTVGPGATRRRRLTSMAFRLQHLRSAHARDWRRFHRA